MPLSPPSSAATPAPQAEDGAVTPLRSQASTSTAASSLQTFEVRGWTCAGGSVMIYKVSYVLYNATGTIGDQRYA